MKVTQSNAINEWTPPRHTNDSARRAGHRADGAWRGRGNVALAPSSPQRSAGCAHPGQGLPAPSTGHRPRCDAPAHSHANAPPAPAKTPPFTFCLVRPKSKKQNKRNTPPSEALPRTRVAPLRQSGQGRRVQRHTRARSVSNNRSHTPSLHVTVCVGAGGGRRRDPDRGTQHGDGLRQLTVNVKFSTYHTFN